MNLCAEGVIICLDIAMRHTGWTVFVDGKPCDWGTIVTPGGKSKEGEVSADRTRWTEQITRELVAIIDRFPGQRIRIWYEYPSGSQAAAACNMNGMVMGAVIATATLRRIERTWVTPYEVKASGVGIINATKKEVMAWVREFYPELNFPKDACHFEHIADSIAVYHAIKNTGGRRE
jgi:Holliday junction resolvasome RuvABC endonuclease subunit